MSHRVSQKKFNVFGKMRTSIQVDCSSEVLVLGQNRRLLVGLQELKRTIPEKQTRHRATRIHFDILQSLRWIRFQKERSSCNISVTVRGTVQINPDGTQGPATAFTFVGHTF